MKEKVKALDERNFLAPADIRFVVSFPRYGWLKLELLFERILHVRFRFKCYLLDLIFKGLNSSA